MGEIASKIARIEAFTADQRTASHGSAGMYAAMMTAGAADGYRLALSDVAEWLRKRGNHGAAADLERLTSAALIAQAQEAPRHGE